MSFVLALYAGWPIEIVYWGLFSTELSSIAPSFVRLLLFYLSLYIRSVTLLPRSRIYSSPLSGLRSFPEKATTSREGEDSEQLADKRDSGNKNTRGSKHSSWGFRYNHNDTFRYNIRLENFASFLDFFSFLAMTLLWSKLAFTPPENVIPWIDRWRLLYTRVIASDYRVKDTSETRIVLKIHKKTNRTVHF